MSPQDSLNYLLEQAVTKAYAIDGAEVQRREKFREIADQISEWRSAGLLRRDGSLIPEPEADSCAYTLSVSSESVSIFVDGEGKKFKVVYNDASNVGRSHFFETRDTVSALRHMIHQLLQHDMLDLAKCKEIFEARKEGVQAAPLQALAAQNAKEAKRNRQIKK